MLRDVFYYGKKPNAHPREKPAKNLADARKQASTEHFWIINEYCDYAGFDWDFDFEFLPDHDVWAEEHINVWPSVYQKDSGTWLVANNDSEIIVYRNDVIKLKRKNIKTSNWVLLDKVDETKFDFGWHPDPTDPPYIYRWGNKYYPVELGCAIEYNVPGAVQVKYMPFVAELLPDWDRWEIPDYIDKTSFDFSWRPDPREPALIYEFGTQWRTNGGPRYICEDATETKYIDGLRARAMPRNDDPCWTTLSGITLEHFDYSWHPDNTSPEYIYVFGNQFYDAVTMPTVEYRMPNATEKKYVHDCWGSLAPSKDNWVIPDNLDVTSFDFRWVPNPNDPPYIYEFGTQWQKTGGPRYIVEGASEIKYIDSQKAIALPNIDNWFVPNNIDKSSFDYSWHPDSTAPAYIYQFGTQWGKSGGPVYIVEGATEVQYVNVNGVALPNLERWKIPDDCNVDNFDFSWHPSIEDKPYIYKFGTQWQKTGGPSYYAVGADDDSPVKYIDVQKAVKLPNKDKFTVFNDYKIENFDFSWHPDETDAPYIYRFGNQFYDAENMPTIEYIVEGATEYKYVHDVVAVLAQDKTAWIIPEDIDDSEFDYSWKPKPSEPPYIYVAGTQHQKTGGPKYIVEGATQIKYLDKSVKKLPNKLKFVELTEYEIEEFDYSWHPDESDPPYIYQFGNTLYDAEIMPTVEYTVEGAMHIKYIHNVKAQLASNKSRWIIPEGIDDSEFDYSWVPNPKDPAYIYITGTQHQKTGGPKYIVEGATEIKYLNKKVKKLEDKSKFEIIADVPILNFDYSWHPDESDPPYVYKFGNNFYEAEIMPTMQYAVEGAMHVKYINQIKATLAPNKPRWIVPDFIDDSMFDYSWIPNPTSPPYIYVAGTQHQKTGGPKYVVEGANHVQYIEQKVRTLPNVEKFEVVEDYNIESFDYSWHPDDTDPPYIYIFGNQHHEAEYMPTIKYTVEGAIYEKYISHIKAKLGQDKRNWSIPKNLDVSNFDFSWKPNPKEPSFVYRFGTQWQKTGGPTYTVAGATEIKYVDFQKAIYLPNAKDPRWIVPDYIDASDFDFSWHPDSTEIPYIYEFGTQWQSNGGVRFEVPGATQVNYIGGTNRAKALPRGDNWIIPDGLDIDSFDFSWHPDNTAPPYVYQFGTQHQKTGGPKYVVPGTDPNTTFINYISQLKAIKLPNKKNWEIPDNIGSFDYSWHPDDTDPPMIYQFGTQWQKTGGPRYVVPGASNIKYVDTFKVKKLPCKDNWVIPDNVDVQSFDFSWHPDDSESPYIYIFGNQWFDAEIMPTIKYVVEGAMYEKYIHDLKATLLPSKKNWIIPKDIDETSFDFSWVPHPGDPAYIYQFGTQWQKTGGPRYVVDGATEIKYIDTIKAKRLPVKDENWSKLFDITDFDFSWHPDDSEPPYVYIFGNQWFDAEIMPTIKYTVDGAMHEKYINDTKATLAPNKKNWIIPKEIDEASFDFSWVPHPGDPPYIYQFGTQWQKTGGPRYVVEDATDIKYVDKFKSKRLPSMECWSVPDNIKDFDYSWHPDDTEPPYIYEFATIWNNRGGPVYTVPDAVFNKYIEDVKATTKSSRTNWQIPDDVDVSEFDLSWVPHPQAPPYVYQFGTQWQKTGGPRYVVPGATEVTYVTDIKGAKKLPNRKNWIIPDDISDFDFSWHPDDTDPAYIYQFGTQWQKTGGPRYVVKGATDIKYESTIKATKLPSTTNWTIPDNIQDFDFSWHPDDTEPPYIYEFATVWDVLVGRTGPIYTVPGAEFRKFVDVIRATTKPSTKNWEIPEGINVSDFDFSWLPDPTATPKIYQFGTTEDENDGPRYITPNNNGEVVKLKRVYAQAQEIVEAEVEPVVETVEQKIDIKDVPKYVITVSLDDLVYEHPDEVFWAIRPDIDYTNFDFNWRPSVDQARYVHVFGSPDYPITQTYFVSAPLYSQGFTDLNFVEGHKNVDEEYLASLFKPNDMFFVDRGNVEAKDRFDRLKQKFPNIQKTRFLNSWVDTINRCINRSNTELCWILNSELNYNDFNFNYYPNQYQTRMVHVFGTQWSHWGTTFLVNRDTFAIDTKYIKIVEHLSNLNFVKDRKAFATNNLYDIVLIDHGNADTDKVKEVLTSKCNGKSITVVKYDNTYLQTLKNIIKDQAVRKEHYIWICSSICDYSKFDFSYICDPFARDNLHVFYSDTQKFGDTFLVDVNTTRDIIDSLEDLRKYPKVAYTGTVKAKRYPAPIVRVESDTHVGALDVDFTFPYMIFATEDFEARDDEPLALWDTESKNIMITSTGSSRIIVPKEAKDIVKNELYDYPYIKTANRLSKSKPLDIVFLSNGELCADENYEHLLAVTKGINNRIVRVDGVDGRVQGYHAALEASDTPWAFTVFAKLKVNAKFDWNWQPDRLQIPKHYIFNAKNPLNGLAYGHQAMIAYNKKLTLANFGKGLDFTLDDPHESIDLLSGTATFNTDPYSTWRTAFREVVKLKSDYSEVAEERLNTWLTVAEGEFAEYCIRGAQDAVEFYDSVMGDIEELRKSYEWAWLKEYYRKKYK